MIAGTLALLRLFVEGDTEYLTLKSICDLCPDLEELHILDTSVCASTETKSAENASTLSEIANDFKRLDKVYLYFNYYNELYFKLCILIVAHFNLHGK